MLLVGHIDAFVVDAGPVFRLFRYTPWKQQASLLTSENRKTPHFFQPEDVPRGPSVAVKKIERERRFRLLGHIPQILVDDGALFPFFLSGQETTSVLKKQEEIRRILRSGPLLFSGPHSKAVSTKKNLKQDYGLWVTLLIMPSTWGHFVLFLFAPKQLYAALVVSNTTSITIHCGPSQLILQM